MDLYTGVWSICKRFDLNLTLSQSNSNSMKFVFGSTADLKINPELESAGASEV